MLDPSQLIGAWRLRACQRRSSAGADIDFYGPDPLGIATFDAKGHMTALIMRRGRPKFATGDPFRGTPEEIRAAYLGFIAYSGTYTVDPAAGTLTTRVLVSLFPDWEGSDQLRHLRLEGDHLSILTAPILVDGATWNFALEWERA